MPFFDAAWNQGLALSEAGRGEVALAVATAKAAATRGGLDLTSRIFEVTGAPSKIDSFIELMRPLGLVEVSRTGVLSIQRGVEVF